MKVALYLRYSSAAQNEQSIEGQRTVCLDYCRRNDLQVVTEYVERGKSAFKDTEKRVVFAQMIKEASQHKWEAVLVYKLDRFSRNKYDSAIYKAKLKKHGVKVLSATESITDSPEGVILESVLEGMAEYYSMELSQKVKRGMHESAVKGIAMGTIPLGYKIVDKHYEINEETAPIVRLIYKLYNEGCSPHTIAETLNSKGYRTQKGELFRDNSFSRIIHNAVYIGTYSRNGVTIENAVPPIVSKEVYDKAQNSRIEARLSPNKGKGKITYLLTGKLVCGHCGANYRGDCGRSKSGKTFAYYSCKNHKDNHSCDAPSIPKELIENSVTKLLYNAITEEAIEQLADACYQANQEDIRKHSTVNIINQQIADLEKEQDNMITSIAKGYIVPTKAYGDRLQEVAQQIEQLQNNLAEAEANIMEFSKDQITFFLRKFLDGDVTDDKFKARLIDMLVKKIVVTANPLPPDPYDYNRSKLDISLELEIALDGVGILTGEVMTECSTLITLSALLQKESNTSNIRLSICGTILSLKCKIK